MPPFSSLAGSVSHTQQLAQRVAQKILHPKSRRQVLRDSSNTAANASAASSAPGSPRCAPATPTTRQAARASVDRPQSSSGEASTSASASSFIGVENGYLPPRPSSAPISSAAPATSSFAPSPSALKPAPTSPFPLMAAGAPAVSKAEYLKPRPATQPASPSLSSLKPCPSPPSHSDDSDSSSDSGSLNTTSVRGVPSKAASCNSPQALPQDGEGGREAAFGVAVAGKERRRTKASALSIPSSFASEDDDRCALCHFCMTPEAWPGTFLRCSRCRKAVYCTEACQRRDLPDHFSDCHTACVARHRATLDARKKYEDELFRPDVPYLASLLQQMMDESDRQVNYSAYDETLLMNCVSYVTRLVAGELPLSEVRKCSPMLQATYITNSKNQAPRWNTRVLRSQWINCGASSIMRRLRTQ